MKIRLVRGDITGEQVDAIVNAANTGLRGGGGVDGAIHRAAGPGLDKACRKIRDTQGGCPTGEAVITAGFKLPAKAVIHTAGPVWHGGDKGEPEQLRRCYINCLNVADDHDMTTIAFPAISTGVYGYPVRPAAEIAIRTAAEFEGNSLQEVRFVLFSDRDYAVYEEVLQAEGLSQ